MLFTDTLRLFLDGTGRSEEYEHYVQRFRSDSAGAFTLLVPDLQSLEEARDVLEYQIRVLLRLDLIPAVLFTGPAAMRMRELWETLPVLEAASREGHRLPRVHVHEQEALHELLPRLTGDVARRIQFVRLRGAFVDRGGLELPFISLQKFSGYDREEDRVLLDLAGRILSVNSQAHISVCSPANLLREIFTVKGAGTVIRKGSHILRYQGMEGVDIERLMALFVRSFGRTLLDRSFFTEVSESYIEEKYRGAALLISRPEGMYLSKFAVDTDARGEGIAQELWDRLVVGHSSLFWRARRENPVNRWYMRVADGMQRSGKWIVFWKGVNPGEIPGMIEWVIQKPEDFHREGP